MKIVYSYLDTGTGLRKPNNWANTKFMLCTMVLSVMYNHRNYGRVEMITDSQSKVWIDKLELPFERITTDLDEIHTKYDKRSWTIGKIKAYSLQTEPFIHADFDVIMFNKFSDSFTSNDIFVQNPEPVIEGRFSWTYNHQIDKLLEMGIKLPIGFEEKPPAFNMGIYGCNDLEFNKKYCDSVFEFMDNHEAELADILPLNKLCYVWEQYFSSVIAKTDNLTVGYITDPDYSVTYESGYIHLLENKYDKEIGDGYIGFVKNEFPEHYARIEEILKDIEDENNL